MRVQSADAWRDRGSPPSGAICARGALVTWRVAPSGVRRITPRSSKKQGCVRRNWREIGFQAVDHRGHCFFRQCSGIMTNPPRIPGASSVAIAHPLEIPSEGIIETLPSDDESIEVRLPLAVIQG